MRSGVRYRKRLAEGQARPVKPSPPKKPTPCSVCKERYQSAASAAAHELRLHGLHRYRGRRIKQLGPNSWRLEGTNRAFRSLAAARLAIDGRREGSVHAVSGGLPTLGKRR